MACGAFGTTAITALTAQNTQGVQGVHPVPRAFLEQQVDSVLGDIGADVVKTGMLPTAEAVQVVAAKVQQWGVRQLVVDPVMVATSGDYLADQSAGRAILELLLPLATIVTPNIPEAESLLGATRGR
jgi:hydroxymethylpyrimidine kinase/phosphomethylpyrimidine kinase